MMQIIPFLPKFTNPVSFASVNTVNFSNFVNDKILRNDKGV